MLVLLRPQGRRLALRLLHASPQSNNLVGPPDPTSHIRPVIYDDVAPPQPPSLLRHPYSLTEFDLEPSGRTSETELLWKMQRQQLDDFNQNFWLDSNTRFEAAKQAILDGLPESSDPRDKERALSEFYKQWIVQEDSRTESYTQEWRERNTTNIALAARVTYEKIASRMGRILNNES